MGNVCGMAVNIFEQMSDRIRKGLLGKLIWLLIAGWVGREVQSESLNKYCFLLAWYVDSWLEMIGIRKGIKTLWSLPGRREITFTNMGSPVREYYTGLQVCLTPVFLQMWKTQCISAVMGSAPTPDFVDSELLWSRILFVS